MVMNPVSGGFTPHKITRDDYESSQKPAAEAAARNVVNNPYVWGVQDVLTQGGPGDTVAATRTKYGNVNLTPRKVMLGPENDLEFKDTPGNQPLDDLPNQSGSLRTEASSTNVPQQDPKEMETDALERRLAMMAKGGQGFPGLNNRNREV